MTMPGQTTLANLRATIRQRADMAREGFISEAELTGYVNASAAELYDLLVTKYGDSYFAKHRQIVGDGSREQFALPADFYKALGVDVDAGSSDWLRLDRFNLNERNRSTAVLVRGFSNLKYRISGGNLWITPAPDAGQRLRVWYVPRFRAMSDTATARIPDLNLAAGDTFVCGVPGSELTLTAVAAGATDRQFNVGISATATATNVAAKLTTYAAEAGLESATSSGQIITATAAAGAPIHWFSTRGPPPNEHPVRMAPWLNVLDGVSGWEEYVVLDCVIKCKQKEESDATAEERQKTGMAARIESAAANRDAGSPATVTDVYAAAGGDWF